MVQPSSSRSQIRIRCGIRRISSVPGLALPRVLAPVAGLACVVALSLLNVNPWWLRPLLVALCVWPYRYALVVTDECLLIRWFLWSATIPRADIVAGRLVQRRAFGVLWGEWLLVERRAGASLEVCYCRKTQLYTLLDSLALVRPSFGDKSKDESEAPSNEKGR